MKTERDTGEQAAMTLRPLPGKDFTGAEIAVIGMAGTFPGAPNVRAYWRLLVEGVEAISRFSDAELRLSGVPERLIDDPRYVPAKGVIAHAECFDNEFFGYSPREAALLDPQIRLMHECAWRALEDAGYAPCRYEKRIGIYAGASSNPLWHARALGSDHVGLAHFLSDKDYLCSRIAHKLDLRGPAVFVQTACSTSLVAVHVACRALLTGDCDMALAGGVSLKVPHKVGYLHQDGMIASSDGHCRSFDARADGAVAGEGAGLVVLKPFAKAAADGDHIYAVIRSSAINNDGRDRASFTAPSVRGQADVIRRAHKLARIDPASISLVEAHGTGTFLGDPVEVEALRSAFDGCAVGSCVLGSVKPNIGHLDHAAGIAGFIKATLCVQRGQIPSTLHFENPNPLLRLNSSPFQINACTQEWPRRDGLPRRAAVTSLGVGGTNAHVVIEETSWPQRVQNREPEWSLLLTSARTEKALDRMHDALAEHLASSDVDGTLADLAYTLQVGRSRFPHRHVIVCRSEREACEALASSTAVSSRRGSCHAHCTQPPRHIAFLFPGQGTQHVAMGRSLYESFADFRQSVDECLARLRSHSDHDFRALLLSADGDPDCLQLTEVAQPLIFVFQYALARFLMRLGVEPTALLGHSLGEYTAACLAGVLSLDDALRIVCERGRLMQCLPEGRMLSVRLDPSALAAHLNERISIAATNAPLSTVVSGDTESIEKLMTALRLEGVAHSLLPGSRAFHSQMMSAAAEAFESSLHDVKMSAPRIACIANLTGDWFGAEAPEPSYWSRHMREEVKFSSGLRTLLELPDVVLIEIGPGDTLSRLVRRHAKAAGNEPIAPTTAESGIDEARRHFLRAIGRLWLRGVEVDWAACQFGPVRRVSAPGQVFERRAFSFGALESAQTYVQQPEAHASDDAMPLSARSPVRAVATDANCSATEIAVAGIFAHVLGLSDIDPRRHFFEMGGDSLMAMGVIANIHRELGARIALSLFFEDPTVQSIAACVDGMTRSAYTSIDPAPEKTLYPVSAAQRRLFIMHQTEIDNVGYNETFHTMIVGEFDLARLEAVFNELLRRHEALRTVFLIDGSEIVQRVLPHASVSIEYYVEDEGALDSLLAQFVRPFRMDEAPLFRVALIRLAAARHLLAWDFHHIITDGTSMAVLYRELIALFHGQALEAPKLQYKDYAEWQNSEQQIALVNAQLEHWLSVYATLPPALNLPTDFPRPRFRTFAGSSVEFIVEGEDLRALREVLAAEKVSLFMILIAIYYVFLGRVSGSRDIAVGSIVAGRRHAQLSEVVGVLVNTLVLRARPDPAMTFREFLASIREQCLGAFDNQEYAYEDLLEHLALERDTSRNSLFDVAFVLQNMTKARDEADALGNASLYPFRPERRISKFDMTLTAVEGAQSIAFTWDYSTNLFSRRTIEVFIQLYCKMLGELARDPCARLADVAIEQPAPHPERAGLAELEDWVL